MTTIPPDSAGSESVPKYRYEPLMAADAVRVLIVHPADRLEDPLRCSITQYVRSTELTSDNYCNRQHYSAVSYTWGAALFSHQLLIAEPSVPGIGGAAPAYLKISANVDSLLRHLRKAHKAVPLWIDAVCLNQMDKKEIAQQIPNMGDIYRAAKKVHIWLGDDNIDDARRVFSIMRQVGLRDEWSPSQEEVSLLAKFFGRVWFTRRWIVQESVLAHEARLHCGSDSLALSWVLLSLKKARFGTAGLDVLGYGPKMLLSSIGKYQEAPGRCSLLTLLRDLHLSECTDARDRIAALYGLASFRNRPPDLRYDEGATKLYWDCAAYFVNRDAMSAHALILHLAEFGSCRANPQGREAPSWVPDWSGSRRPLLYCNGGLQNVFESLDETKVPQHETSTVLPVVSSPTDALYDDPGFVDYCNKFSHATQMSAQGDVLRIHSHPYLVPSHSGIVEKVYCCGSSGWKDVWLMFSHMAHDASIHDPEYSHLGQLLAAVHKHMWGKEMLLADLKALILSTRLSRSPPQEDIERLEAIGSILSRFSLIRGRTTWRKSRNGMFSHGDFSFYHLGPRDAAVGDFLVPFITSSRESHTSEDCWSVAMCLRPTGKFRVGTLRVGTKTCTDNFDPEVPFCRTVRWVGVTFYAKPQGLSMGSEDGVGLGYIAYHYSVKNGLPGPYVFDVI